MPDRKLWDQVLDKLRRDLIPDELRRWFGESTQAGDTGDQVTVWVPSEPVRRHILLHYQDLIDRALEDMGRQNVEIRLVSTGVAEDDDEDDS
jgi:chromosomal replication initiation ATPase DnaA